MTDPFDILRRPAGQTEPDPTFRARLLVAVDAVLDDTSSTAPVAPSTGRDGENDTARSRRGVDGTVVATGEDDLMALAVEPPTMRGSRRRTRWLAVGAVAAAAAL